jgi:hypothetical protein
VQEEKVNVGGERRQDRRYNLRLEVRWKRIQRRQVTESGAGQTLDLSSGGVRFSAGSDLPVGCNVALSIVWPALLHNVAPMLLAIQGKVVRSAKGWAAVRILQHEFRTQGVPRGPREPVANAQEPAPGPLLAVAGRPWKKSY